MDIQSTLKLVTVYAIPVIFAITLHEAAHGYVAKRFGDNTAYVLGRVSLNPARHIDLFGTVIFPLLTLFLGGMLFGWAKPVPVNQGQLREPRRHMIWVVLAGPAANFLMALLWALLLRILFSMGETQGFLWEVSRAGISINLILMVLNLLPIPPLDGGRVLMNIVPLKTENLLARIEPYGIWILLALLLTGVIQPVIGAGINFFFELILKIVFFKL
ncbi:MULTISPECIES: site-2 protease family protein [Oligella]|uniref:Peptidase M50 n=1 Tax=Oligella urethralis DNF00040 TaxID=1401065 RepID=A0A095Z7V0_9BURK|nr:MULTISPECIES: site-2 protease family protein [Oligella]KGF30421.1 peptidase M50 [Oligella urethralis DNF00040]MDK6203087.1 site-2 protease family protein [Oligella urethralis]OFS89534.1 peptidase M50 [Oligella sp. HMSC05A10]OFV48761.1 peptidase M50 [Oligella sp. HMSC09E12]PMC16192.1 site-2 protease family protein [Oligella urethralis]